MNLEKQRIIKDTATLKNTLLLGVLLLIMACFIMPEAEEQIRLVAKGPGRIESSFLYFPGKLHEMVAAYGERGRQLYMAVELTADLFYGLVKALFLCALLVWSSSYSKNNYLSLALLIYLPLFSFLADGLENAGIIWMLCAFPENYFPVSLATVFFSTLKSLLILACFLVATWNLILYGYGKVTMNYE